MFKRAFLFSLILASAAVAHGSQNRVTVKPVVEIEISKTDVTLFDIVATNGLSRSAMDKFKTIKLSDAPLQGETREFTSDVIASSIKPELEAVETELGEHYDIRIPSRVTVTKRRPSMGATEMKAQLLRAFKAICSECEFEISNLNAPATRLSENAVWSLKTRNELPKGSFSYPIEVTVGDVVSNTYWVSGQLNVRRKVPVAVREIGVGERIQPEDVVTQMKDVTFSTDAPVSSSELSSGVAARSISVGQIVFHSSLRREMAVKMGDIVRVESGTADWTISLGGVAESSAYIGDQVKVKIPSTSKVVAGVLKEKGVVEVIQ